MAEAVTLHGVEKRFGGARAHPVPVLDGVDLAVRAGEFVALLGPSGCGKSTLLRLVAGLDHPTGGEVRLGAGVVRDVDARCAVVFQEPRLLPWRTVAGNVALGLRGRPGDPTAMLERVGLSGFGNHDPHQLSGGMAQRVALARALIGQPQVLLLDEPFASLDALTRLRMHDLLLDACRPTQPTVVMVTHDVDEALRLADRVVLLGGRPAHVVAGWAVPGGAPGQRDVAALADLRAEILGRLGLSSPRPIHSQEQAVA